MKNILANSKKWSILFLFVFHCIVMVAQPFRYTTSVFTATDTLKNVEYATAEWLNNSISFLSEYNIHDGESITETRPLYMDIFMPRNDTLTKRPAIIFSHSGAFLIGSKQNDDMLALCDSFARKGYVTATLGYRLGMGATVSKLFGMIVGLRVDEKNAFRAAYRGIQDSRAAIRFLKKNAGEYGVDSSKIFMVGSSAGGIQALSTIYLDKQNEIPEYALAEPSLGELDAIGMPGANSLPSAVVSLWGAVWDTQSIENTDIPVLLVHGEADNIVPFKKGIPLEGTVPDNPLVSFTMPETYGSFCIDTALNNRGILHETYFVKDKKHEFYGAETGAFPPEGPNQYWDTIQQKITNFFIQQFQPVAKFNFETIGQLLTTSNNSTTNYMVSWNFGDENSTSEWEPQHNYATPGEYKITLKVCNENLACDSTSTTVTIDAVQTAAEYKTNLINIYPNPGVNKINISGISPPYSATIYGLTGKVQFYTPDIQNNQINISALKPGMYIIQIENKSTSTKQKLIKWENRN